VCGSCDGVVVAQPFLDVGLLVSTTGEEVSSRRLPPRYWADRLRRPGRLIQVAEYRRSASNALLADPLSARPILTIPHPTFPNH
jgi:hypothetical protein